MDDEAVVDWKGLKEQFGWTLSRTQTWLWMNDGLFPRCFKLRNTRNSHPLWKRREIVEFLRKPPSP